MGTEIETDIQIWMPDGTIETYKRTATEQLKVAIIGGPKFGKSRLASTAPKKPIFYFDFDGRLAAVSGIKDVFGKTYLDTSEPNRSTAWREIETDMQNFEYQKATNKPIPGTMVFDSITYMCDRAMRKYLVDNITATKDVKSLIVNKRTYLTPSSWEPYKAEQNMVGNMLARGIELGCDVIAIFHERPEEAAESNAKEKKYTGKVSVHPPRAEVLIPLFNEYWRVMPDYANHYKVITRPTSDFTGGTCLNIDGEEPADITQMIQKHNKNTIEKEKENEHETTSNL